MAVAGGWHGGGLGRPCSCPIRTSDAQVGGGAQSDFWNCEEAWPVACGLPDGVLEDGGALDKLNLAEPGRNPLRHGGPGVRCAVALFVVAPDATTFCINANCLECNCFFALALPFGGSGKNLGCMCAAATDENPAVAEA